MTVDVHFRKHKELPVLQLSGRLSEGDSDTVSVSINALCREQSATLILDLSKLNFIDSQGLGKLVSLNASLQKENRKLVVLNSNPDPDAFVPSLFTMTNLTKILKIVKNLDELQAP